MKKEVTWTAEEWKDWKWHQKHRIRNMEQLEEWIDVTPDEREAFRLTDPIFHMGITPYYAALMDPTNLIARSDFKQCPRWKRRTSLTTT
mgnify:CR=1 FL=1